jgi:hypothetical protein
MSIGLSFEVKIKGLPTAQMSLNCTTVEEALGVLQDASVRIRDIESALKPVKSKAKADGDTVADPDKKPASLTGKRAQKEAFNQHNMEAIKWGDFARLIIPDFKGKDILDVFKALGADKEVPLMTIDEVKKLADTAKNAVMVYVQSRPAELAFVTVVNLIDDTKDSEELEQRKAGISMETWEALNNRPDLFEEAKAHYGRRKKFLETASAVEATA